MILKRKLMLSVISAIALASTVNVTAQTPNYNLLELVIAHSQSDTTGIQTGYIGNASVDIDAGFFAEASGTHESGNSSAGGFLTNSYLGGLGYRVSFPITDVFLSLDSLHVNSETPTTSSSNTGYRWVWGLRTMATSRLELNTGVEKASVGNTSTGVRLGESYEFAGHAALRAQYTWSHHVKSWVIGLRVYY
jgi:hypothetical protein